MTDLREAAQAVIDRWDSPLWKNGSTADAIADLRTALEQQAEPSQWRDMVVVTLVREGVNKHKARELADHFAAPPQQQAEPLYKDSTAHLVRVNRLLDLLKQARHYVDDDRLDFNELDGRRRNETIQDHEDRISTAIQDNEDRREVLGCIDEGIRAALAHPEQEPFDDLATEPVATVQCINGITIGYIEVMQPVGTKLYTTPPQRKELSASEILNMMPSTIPAEYDGELMEFARAVEAKLKEKNT